MRRFALLPIALAVASSFPSAAAAQGSLKGCWTPPAWSYSAQETASMPTVLLLTAGETLALRVLPGGHGLGRQARWESEFGVVGANGDYTAPPYLPPDGEDTLTYRDPVEPTARTLRLTLRLLPNSHIPGSQYTPYVYRAGPSESVVLTPPARRPPAAFLRTVTVVQRGERPAPALEYTQARPVPRVKVAGVRAYCLPATDDAGTYSSVVYVLRCPPGGPLRQAKVLPMLAGDPHSDPDPRMPHLGKGGSRKWQTWRKPCP